MNKGSNRDLLILVLGGAFFALLPLFIENDFYLDGFILIFVWGAFAGAWNLISGYGGMVSLGHNAFFGIGAYTSTLLFLKQGISPWIGMWAGAVIAAVIGVLLGIICFRLRSHYFALATLAFGQVASIVALNWRGLTEGAEGLTLPIQPSFAKMIFATKLGYVYLGLAFLVAVLLITYLIDNSRLGYFLIAFRENEEAARALGVRTGRVRLVTMAISSALSALIGSFYAQYLLYIDPSSVIRIQIAVQVALFAIVGGIGTVFGPFVGALIFIPITIFLRAKLGSSLPGLHMVIYGGILILVLFYMPKGIYGMLRERYFPTSRIFK